MQGPVKRWSPPYVMAGTVALSGLPLLIVQMFPGQLNFVIATAPYVVLHNIAEFFSVMVSLSMFGVGWYTYDQSKDRHALFLSAAFLAIGLMDFMHALSNAAMPAFITPNSSNKSTQYWVAVRLFQAAAFLGSAYVYSERPRLWLSKRVLMASALLVPLLVFVGITLFPSKMPATFVVGVGLTPFKVYSEYLTIGLLCAAAAAYWQRMARTGDRLLRYYLAALVICIFSELAFAFYTRVFDTYNVLGHVYKVAAFYLIYRGIYTASVKDPYIRVADIGERLKRDIAERELVEQALRKSEEKYRTLVQNIQAAVVVHGSDSEIVTSNSLAQKQLGLTEEQMLGKKAVDPAWHFFREDGTVLPLEEFPVNQVLATRKPLRDFVIGVHRTNLGNAWVLVNADPVVGADGKIIQVIVTFVDVTERKRIEEALRQRSHQLRALASELTMVEHRERRRIAQVLHDDLQQLLVGARLRLAELQRLPDPTVSRTAVEVEDFINQSLAVTRSLTRELSPPILHEGGLARAIEWLAQWMGDKHGLKVIFTTTGDVPQTAEGTRILLFQAVRELLFNVVKHAQVSTASVQCGRRGDRMQIVVQDEGCGFDPARLLGEGGGVGGFGLFSIRERLELQGGHLEIESAPGTGSRFTLLVPLEPAASKTGPADAPPVPRREREVLVQGGGRRLRVLVVDDHVVVRQGLVRLLATEPDLEVVGEASGGREAVELTRKHRPDVIVMDVSMREMNGIQATRAIHAELPQVKVIGLSMHEESEEGEQMRQAGAVHFVSKLGPSEALLTAIRACIRPDS